ncbi:MAG: AraC family transcriptional regulator [Clostridia bacterium]|nr:AraC family transcriptional regulator [Clostridia bacterium]
MSFTIRDSDYMDMKMGFAFRFLDIKTAIQSMHNHNYYEYFIITSGKIVHEVNGQTQYLKAGDLLFIRPGDTHRYNIDKTTDCNIINVSFRTVHFERVAAYLDNPAMEKLCTAEMPPSICLNAQRLSALKRKHYMLNVCSNNDELLTMLKTLLVDTFSYMLMEYEQQAQADLQNPLHPALLQMNTPESIEEGLPALLRYSGFSHGHLCRIMKKEYNTTPIKYITDLRLQYAANLLVTTDYDILSISVRLGFSSLSYFITIFKKKYGVTPSRYRAEQSNAVDP